MQDKLATENANLEGMRCVNENANKICAINQVDVILMQSVTFIAIIYFF